MTATSTFRSDRALFDCPSDVFNEIYDTQGQPRAHWQQVLDSLKDVPAAEFARRMEQADRMLRDNGVAYNSRSAPEVLERPWKLDLMPFVLATDEWKTLESGLQQRATLLNRVIHDLYGEQSLLRDKIIPPEILFGNPEYIRPFVNLAPHEQHPLFLYATELARSPDGHWYVMADRTEAPAGPGFAFENRVVVSRSIPAAFRRISFHRLPSFFNRLKNSLSRRCNAERENPQVVMLTHGPTHSYYFEDVYLARYLGYTLVEAEDLAVRNDAVFLKTLGGLIPVDIVLTRSAEMQIDPLEVVGSAQGGVPGILHAARRGHVTVANVPGCGILGAPVFMSVLPRLCKYFLGEQLKIPSIATWWGAERSSLDVILQRLPELVVKPAFQKSGGAEYIISEMSTEDVTQLTQQIRDRPWEWVAQEKIKRSGVPIRDGDGFRCGHVAMRTFCVEDEGKYHVMPGGLVRVASDTRPMQLSVSAGDSSKDMWVLTDGESAPVTLLAPLYQPATLRRTTALMPSRVADNLFWLGRNLDRVDILVRVLRSLIQRESGERDSETADIAYLQKVLQELGHWAHEHESPSSVDNQSGGQEGQILAAFSFARTAGLTHAIKELDRLASLLQDWLSPDAWTAISKLVESFQTAPVYPENDLSDIAVLLNQLVLDTAAVSGLIGEGMNRGPSWRFLDLGRCIERMVSTAQMLLCGDLHRAPTAAPVLKAMLELIDVQMTYRLRYRDQLQRNAVLDLGITDDTSPRSLAFQIHRLEAHVKRLPNLADPPLPEEDKRLVLKCSHAIRMLNDADLAAASATAVIDALKCVHEAADSLSGVLTRKFLVHSGTPRRISSLFGGRP